MPNEDEETPDVVLGDVIDTAPDEVVNEGDTVVVVETPDDSTDAATDAVELAVSFDLTERVTRLETELEQLRGQVFDAEITAEVALSEATAAVQADEEIVEAVDEAIVETVEGAEIEDGGLGGDDTLTTDEIAPVSQRVHPLFRSRADWFNK